MEEGKAFGLIIAHKLKLSFALTPQYMLPNTLITNDCVPIPHATAQEPSPKAYLREMVRRLLMVRVSCHCLQD